MTSETLVAIQTLLQLGWPAIVLVEVYVLFRVAENRTQKLVDTLTALLEKCLDDDHNTHPAGD